MKLLDGIARAILRFFRNKNLKYGVNSIVVTAIVVALLVVLNLLVGIPQIKFDLTPNRLYSIGDTTKELLSGLTEQIEVVALFDELQPPSTYYVSAADAEDALKMLDSYTSYPNVKLTYVDPDKNPGFMQELDPDGTLALAKGNFVVRRGNKTKKLVLNDLFEIQTNEQTYESQVVGMKAEEALSGAIQYVAAHETPIVYFIEGHDELALSDFASLQSYLLNNNYLVESLSLRSLEAVPADAELLVFTSPKLDLFQSEVAMLHDYFFNEGGKAMFLFDYSEYAADLENFNRVLGEFNLAINNDKVRSDDDNYHAPEDPYTIFFESGRNVVFSEAILTILSNSRSVSRLMNTKEWITQTSLLTTSALSTSEPLTASGTEKGGPLDIAVAVENTGGMAASKIIAIGNGSFIADSAARLGAQIYQVNARMFLYSLRWLLGEQDTLTIEPKDYSMPQLTITASQTNAVAIGVVFVLPLLIMGAGLVVYLKRRHL
ncbi:MAG: GldG family protein [Clostridiales bacterium]|jgi:hypothetical protein|nr:GldG family protein [Clostridiales bacterium]